MRRPVSFAFILALALGLVSFATAATNDQPESADDSYSVVHDFGIVVAGTEGVLANDSGGDLSASLLSDASNGDLELYDDGGFSYTPDGGFVGDDTFAYTATNADGSDTGTATIHVTNQMPTAGDDGPYGGLHDLDVSVPAPGVLSNDGDTDGDTLTPELATLPSHGSVTVGTDGGFDYTPDPGYVGGDSFTYKITDGVPNSSATATVGVVLTNNAPSASDDPGYSISHTGQLNETAPGVLGNDTDIDVDDIARLTAVNASDPDHGTVSLATDGGFVYTPDFGYTGPDWFTYDATDGAGSSSATVYIDVTNAPPCTCPDEYSISHSETLTVDATEGVLANDSDADGDPFTADLLTGPDHAVDQGFSLDPSGSFTYQPESTFADDDTFTYKANDGYGALAALVADFVPGTTVTIHVTSQAPTTVNDGYANSPDTQLNVVAPGVLYNDSDADPGDTLTATYPCGITPQHGTATVYSNGALTYTPDPGYSGLDTFGYGVKDQTDTPSSGCGTVTINMGGTTAVQLVSSSAKRVARGTLVRWRTGTEAGIAGFKVYRERAGRRALASKPIAASGGAEGHGYSWLDRGARGARYWLRVLDVAGRATWFGPIR